MNENSIIPNLEIKHNPWDVNDLDEFLYYCCPECDEKVPRISKEKFIRHALSNHSNVSEIFLMSHSIYRKMRHL